MERNEQIEQASQRKYPYDCSTDHFTQNMRNEFVKLFRRCFIEGVDWADEHPKNNIEEELDLITQWFEHIAQLADDRKTANGAVMEDWAALDEIKALAKNSANYVKNHLK